MIKQFGLNVRALVKVSNLKMGDFEKAMGLSKGYISRLCSGGTEFVTLAATIKIANYFDKTIDELLTKDFVKSCEKELLERQLASTKAMYEKEMQSIKERLDKVNE